MEQFVPYIDCCELVPCSRFIVLVLCIYYA